MNTFTRRFLPITILFCWGALPAIAQSATVKPALSDTTRQLQASKNYQEQLAKTSILFTENKGQITDDNGNSRPDILFTANGGAARIFLTSNGISYQFSKTEYAEGYKPGVQNIKERAGNKLQGQSIKTTTEHFSISLLGANAHPRVRKELPNSFTENFYLRHCPQGITDVHTYGRIVFEEVYPGIDWVVYSKSAGFEYDFIIHPNANPELIKLKVKDADDVSLATDGALLIKTNLGAIRQASPISFSNGQTIVTHFTKRQDGSIGFAINSYDKTKILRIDPSVSWATYYGGSDNDYAQRVRTDKAGNIFIAGTTSSHTGIAAAGHQTSFGSGPYDAFLVKLDAAGNRLWATYYGGSDQTFGSSCAIDTSGNIYLVGLTSSTSGIATTGSFMSNYSGGYFDCFLVKFSNTGTRLWGTYYGGYNDDEGMDCTIDKSNNVYITGNTMSASGIAASGFQNTLSGSILSSFLAKFTSSGARVWGTYYSGNNSSLGTSCITDKAGNVYMAGYTNSASGIAASGFQNTYGGGSSLGDAFLVKFRANGNRAWATYYGGSGDEFPANCVIDSSGNIYMAGSTNSTSGIAAGGYQNTYGGGDDAFWVKFDSLGARKLASYYGDSGDDYGTCALDSAGNFLLAGSSTSTTGIAFNGFQNTIGGGSDGFLAKFNTQGARLWGSYFGGNGDDFFRSAVFNRNGNIYLAGSTNSSSGIAINGFQNTYGGGNNQGDALVVRISDISIKLASTKMCSGDTIPISYITTDTFLNGNVFTAQLSDATGSFATPVTIGSLSDTFSNTIIAVIPPGTATGTGYRVRVVASIPQLTGADNGANILIMNPPVVAITSNGNTLKATPGFTSYLWMLNGNVIPGATSANYSASQSGSYVVVVTNANGCSDSSLPFVYKATNVVNTSAANELSVYPNPVQKTLTLETNLPSTQTIGVNVTDVTGRVILSNKNMVREAGRSFITIDASLWTSGLYLVQVQTENGALVYKIAKE